MEEIILPFTLALDFFPLSLLQFSIKSTKRIICNWWLDTKIIWNSELQLLLLRSFWLRCTRIKLISLILFPFTLFLDLSLQFFTESTNKKKIYKDINTDLKFWTATFTILLATFWISFRYHYNSSPGQRTRE